MKQIPLTKGYVAPVDDDDYEAVIAAGPWFANVRKSGKVYAIRNKRGKGFIYLHQTILGHKSVDHRNGGGLDNQKANLRACTKAQNAANINKPHAHKGTTFDTFTGRWKAQIMVSGKHLNLGRFNTQQEAATAYNEAAKEHFGEFANVS